MRGARQRLLTRLALLFALAWLLCPPVHAGEEFVVDSADTRLVERTFLLNAQVHYHLSEAALEALDNGVPLTLEMRIQVRRKGAWIWESNLLERRDKYSIRYKPLPELYQVTRIPQGRKQSFATREAALDALGEVEDLPLLDRERLDPAERYLVRIKVSLDVEALPLPLRPMAYLKPSWNLSSGWTEWPLEP